MNMKKLLPYILLSFLIVAVLSCTCKRSKNLPKKEKEIEQSEIKVNIVRFERALFACNPNRLDTDLVLLRKKYPVFFDVFYNQVLNIPAFGDKGNQLNIMQEFISKKAMKGLYDTVQQKFQDLTFLENDLKVAFFNYKSYFPEKPIPVVYTCVSEFSYSVFTATDSILGISLDKYLGPTYIYYQTIFPEFTYMITSFDQKYMAVDCANVLAANLITAPTDKSTLLDKMIIQGKLLYTIQCLLPHKEENIIIKYNMKQWNFCINNEPQIWAYFLDHNLLYDTKYEQYKYIQEGPSTYGMPQESPGRVGAWLGWQIIQAYMKEHPSTTLKQLIALKDGQQILSASKYKPKQL